MKIKKTVVLAHYIVYCFKISTGNQFLQCRIQISALLSLASLIEPASLIAKRVDSPKSKMELQT
jgi:hypothetical protein